MKKYLQLTILAFVTFSLFSCSNEKQMVDLIVYNALIYSVNDSNQQFESMAIHQGKIVELGTNKDILDKYESTQKIDLNGKYVYPGLIDAHCHFYGYAVTKETYCDLNGISSMEQIIAKLKEFRSQHTDQIWLLGRGWDQNIWKDKRLPDNELLSKSFPDFPVMLIRVDGHAVLANKKALEMISFTKETKIEGGNLLKKGKELSGILLENAADSMKSFIPPFESDLLRKAILHAQHNCFSVGLTSIQDAGLEMSEIKLLQDLLKLDALKLRIYAMLSPTEENLDYWYKNGPLKHDRFHINAVKFYADGALGSRGACLLHPYNDDTTSGMMLFDKVDFTNKCQKAYDAGFQVATHAIGDSAIRMVLDVYSSILKQENDKRWRIEHSQVVDLNDLPKFKLYAIIPSVNTTHATSDMFWAPERLGNERVSTAYAYQHLLQQNGWLPNGSDFPVESINPIYGFYAAVARKNLKGEPKSGFQIENALSRIQALRAMTIWAAKAAFEENIKGSLEKGKFADFVVLDQDILNVEESKIPRTKVLATYVNGEQVY